MIEAIKAIAMLCAVHSGSGSESFSMRVQRDCQSYYASCVDTFLSKGKGYDNALLLCAKKTK